MISKFDKWGNYVAEEDWGIFKVMGKHIRNDEWTWVADFANEEDAKSFIELWNDNPEDEWEYDYEAL